MGPSIILAPIQITVAIGEWTSQFIELGWRGIWRAFSKKHSPQGRAILNSNKYFSGHSLKTRLTSPGNNIGDIISNLIWSIMIWTRFSLSRNLLLANLTDEEYATGQISNSRLAQIRLNSVGSLGQLSFTFKVVILALTLVILTAVSGKHNLAFALALAPMARILIGLWEYKDSFSGGMGSIFFKRYVGLFKWLSTIAGAMIWYALYKFAQQSGLGSALWQFVCASLLQVPLYAVLKMVLPYEILLIPFTVLGVGFMFLAFVG